MIDKKVIRGRIVDVFQLCKSPIENYSEVFSSTLSILIILHGENSKMVEDLIAINKHYHSKYHYSQDAQAEITHHCKGVLSNIYNEVKLGLLTSLEKEISGEVYGGLINMGKSCAEGNAKDAAAVLGSAALEDALKRYAKLNKLDVEDKDMSEVVNALKSKGLIKGPQAGIIASYIRLRNKAFHAEFDKFEMAEVKGLLAFTEEFILKNFS